jgi:hypothetical protein
MRFRQGRTGLRRRHGPSCARFCRSARGRARWVLPLLNDFGRIPVCGLIAQYNGADLSGPDHLPATMREILTRSLTVRGYIWREFAASATLSSTTCRPGLRRAASAIARISSRDLKKPLRHSSACCRAGTSGNCSSTSAQADNVRPPGRLPAAYRYHDHRSRSLEATQFVKLDLSNTVASITLQHAGGNRINF